MSNGGLFFGTSSHFFSWSLGYPVPWSSGPVVLWPSGPFQILCFTTFEMLPDQQMLQFTAFEAFEILYFAVFHAFQDQPEL